MTTARERLGNCIPVAMNTHATIKELLEMVFLCSLCQDVITGMVWSNEFSAQLKVRLGGLCEMASTLGASQLKIRP
jgi:hypothetical protein